MFDFTVHHIPGRKHCGLDGLSRRSSDSDVEDDNDSVEECIDDDLGINTISSVPSSGILNVSGFSAFSTTFGGGIASRDLVKFNTGNFTPTPARKQNATQNERPIQNKGLIVISLAVPGIREYDAHYASIIHFLQTLETPKDLSTRHEKLFRMEITKYHIVQGKLFRCRTKGRPSQRVIYQENHKKAILAALHDKSGHRGKDGKVNEVLECFWWKNVYRDTEQYVKPCNKCQRRINIRVEEELYPNLTSTMWHHVHVDVIHMPKGTSECKYIVVTQEDVSGWPEIRALRKATIQAVADFLHEENFARHGCPTTILVDSGSENKAMVDNVCNMYSIKKHTVTGYHPQVNGIIERGHKQLVDGLSKACAKKCIKRWLEYLVPV